MVGRAAGQGVGHGPGRQIAQQQAAAARPILTVPIEVTIPKPPTATPADGKTHLGTSSTSRIWTEPKGPSIESPYWPATGAAENWRRAKGRT